MTPTAEVVIVGGGIMGASLAYHLTLGGVHDVVVIEQGQMPGRGATVRSAGLLRQHHTASCDVQLAVRSLAMFEQWADTVGGDCGYRQTGFALLVAAEYAEALRRNVGVINAAGGSACVLDADELVATYPGLSPEGIGAAAYEPNGGFADPVRAANALLAAARARGARVAEGIVVTKILTDRESASGLETNAGDIACRRVVLAGA